MSDTRQKQSGKQATDDSDITSTPDINTLTFADIRVCLRNGIADYRRAPLIGIFLGSIFAVIGLFITLSLFVWEKSWMMYPMLIGFPLIGPFAAVGLYEVSRRIEAGAPLAWNEILSVVRLQSRREIRWMAFVMLFIFWVWMYQVRLLIALILGRMSFATLESFIEIITTTREGLIFIIAGHIVGACLALVLFSVTVISMPLLLDREVDFITAMITSIKTVLASPLVMLSWGVFVTLAIMLSFVPAFLGLLLVLPILGHTTWHLYRKAINSQTA